MNDYTSMIIHRAKQVDYERDAELERLADESSGVSQTLRLGAWLQGVVRKLKPEHVTIGAMVEEKQITSEQPMVF